MSNKQFEFQWDDKQVWHNIAYVSADSLEEAMDLFEAEKYDYPVDSRFSHYDVTQLELNIKEYEVVSRNT